ncbi:hypothetical protein [Polyangium aurulentum]|uniref:hypothetical protein n=1 Tax=Polyangium aurulentum TaxID=2567896 RepID=UPI0010AEC3C4|nr:hypothetical protein [Polyangium aurulentum]UQA56983.1 hypothetical protein E8A73_037680 [Polyangium aurulentum]
MNLGPKEYVNIYMAEANGNLRVRIAPYAVLASTFPDTNTFLTVETMKTDTLRPISVPNFDVDVDSMPYLNYGDGSPAWNNTEDKNYQYLTGAPEISQSLTTSNATIYAPYIQFQGTGVPNLTGQLTYGLVFVVTRDGVTQEYFYFDPILMINQPNSVRRQS